MSFTILKHAARSGGLAALAVGMSAGFACAATLNQNLGIWQEEAEAPVEMAPLMVVDPVATLPPVARPRPIVPVQTRVAPSPIGAAAPAPTAAEIVGKLLAPRASDPDVPLPHPDLSEKSESGGPLTGPALYGRSEPGGGVVGFRVPIPVDKSGSTGNTRYGSDDRPAEASPPGLLRRR